MKNLKFKFFLVIFVFIILIFSINLSINGRKNVSKIENFVYNTLMPIQEICHNISDNISDILYPIKNIFTISEENKKLKEEIDKLNHELVKNTLTADEYEDLKKLKVALNYTEYHNIFNYITADIIARDPSNWYDIFVINVGKNDGIVKDSMVIDGKGFIGQVYEAYNKYSKVITMSSVKGAISFVVLNSEYSYDGIVKGNENGIFNGYFFDDKAEPKIGDKIITSGLGIYPKGIMIGEIIDINTDPNSLLKNIVVKSFVDFKNIGRVFVIPPKNTIEEKVLENE